MIAAPTLVLAATLALLGDHRAPLIARGGDPARGLLVNHNPGAAPFHPPDPARPTVVFIHGFNPMPRTVHFTMAGSLAQALGQRPGSAPGRFNVLAWDWNAATFDHWRARRNIDDAVAQGPRLAAALLGSGLDPARVHLIGHSAGGLVATSAARELALRYGRPVAQLTLLEPAAFYHDTVFDALRAGSLAPRVENYWSPGPSGFGQAAPRPGVANYQVPGPTPYFGVVCPLRSSHLALVDWYVASAADPGRPGGFNTSVLLLAAGP